MQKRINRESNSDGAQSLGPPTSAWKYRKTRQNQEMVIVPGDQRESPRNASTNLRYNSSKYKQMMDPYGVEMQHSLIKAKEVKNELLMMENRIKLLQYQENKMKKKNEN